MLTTYAAAVVSIEALVLICYTKARGRNSERGSPSWYNLVLEHQNPKVRSQEPPHHDGPVTCHKV